GGPRPRDGASSLGRRALGAHHRVRTGRRRPPVLHGRTGAARVAAFRSPRPRPPSDPIVTAVAPPPHARKRAPAEPSAASLSELSHRPLSRPAVRRLFLLRVGRGHGDPRRSP